MAHQKNPNQIPTPWMIAIGNIIAPAMRKPHASSDRQVKMWVNQAAMQDRTKMTAKSSAVPFPFSCFIFSPIVC